MLKLTNNKYLKSYSIRLYIGTKEHSESMLETKYSKNVQINFNFSTCKTKEYKGRQIINPRMSYLLLRY